MNQKNSSESVLTANEETNAATALAEKLIDALIPGLHVEFDPEEASMAGAFIEDALTEEDAAQSAVDSAIPLCIEANERTEA